MKNNRRAALFLCALGLVVVTVMLGFGLRNPANREGSVLHEPCNQQFPFINPFLRCEEPEVKREFVAFKKNLESFIQENVSRGNARIVSVYFRDLENGPWFGVDEQALFSPASMMKLPLLVAYYKRAEADPKLLAQHLTVEGVVPEDDDGIAPVESLQAGSAYTVDELLRRMIIESDNAALPVLFSNLQQFYPDEDVFTDTLVTMGIAASEGSQEDFLTVKRYASIYRILYNASFLSKEMSQKALDLLTQSRSPQGMRDGVPAEVPVAHKFGVRERPDSMQLHDCGIVYHPENHYLLCIMTRGEDVTKLSPLIADISRMVYEEVNARVEEDGYGTGVSSGE